MVGDAPRDIAAGHAAGLQTVLLKIESLPPSPATTEGSGVEPDFVASSLRQAIEFIERNAVADTTEPAVDDRKPAETPPVEAPIAEATPVEDTPEKATPVEAAPVEAAPVEASGSGITRCRVARARTACRPGYRLGRGHCRRRSHTRRGLDGSGWPARIGRG